MKPSTLVFEIFWNSRNQDWYGGIGSLLILKKNCGLEVSLDFLKLQNPKLEFLDKIKEPYTVTLISSAYTWETLPDLPEILLCNCPRTEILPHLATLQWYNWKQLAKIGTNLLISDAVLQVECFFSVRSVSKRCSTKSIIVCNHRRAEHSAVGT